MQPMTASPADNRTVAALRAEVERLNALMTLKDSLLEHYPGMVYRCRNDVYWTMEYISVGAQELTGYDRSELTLNSKTSYAALIHVDDRDMVEEQVQAALEANMPFDLTYRIVTASGQEKWVRERGWRTTAVDTGEAIIEGFIADVTPEKSAELNALRRESILRVVSAARQLLEGADIWQGIEYMLADLGEATDVSRVYIFENHTDIDGTLLLSQRFEWVSGGVSVQLNNPDLQNLSYEDAGYGRWRQVLAQGAPVYGLIREFPESERPLLEEQDVRALLVVPIAVAGQWWGFMGFDECNYDRVWQLSDIDVLQTAADFIGAAIYRERSRNQQTEQTNLIQQILDNSPAPIHVRDIQGRFTLVNVAYRALFDYVSEDLIGKAIEDIYEPQSAAVIRKNFDDVLHQAEVIVREEELLIGGSLQYFSAIKFPVRNNRGTVIGVGGISTNITSYKQIEAAVRASRQMLQLVIDNIPQAIYWKNHELRFEGCNRAFAEQAGLISPDVIVGWTDADLPWAFAAARYAAEERQVMQQNAPRLRVMEELPSVDGQVRWVEVSRIPLHSEAGEVVGILGLIEDVTERKRFELERQQMQEQVIAAQQSAIRELSTPLIPIAPGVVVLPLVGSVDEQRATQVLESLLEGVEQYRAQMVLLDITGVRTVDTHVANTFMQAAQAVRLLGARVMLTGIQPAIAQTLVNLGVDLRGLETRSSLQDGIAAVLRQQH